MPCSAILPDDRYWQEQSVNSGHGSQAGCPAIRCIMLFNNDSLFPHSPAVALGFNQSLNCSYNKSQAERRAILNLAVNVIPFLSSAQPPPGKDIISELKLHLTL